MCHLNSASALVRLLLLVMIASCLLPIVFSAADEYQDELERLRSAEKYEDAVKYLERLKDDDSVPEEFKATILLELGVTYVQWSHTLRDPMAHRSTVDSAATHLREFLKTQSEHPSATTARTQLANVLVEQARVLATRARNLGGDSRQADGTRSDEFYEEAFKLCETNKSVLQERLTRIPVDAPKDSPLIRIRDQMCADYLQALLLMPAVLEERADGLGSGAMSSREERLSQAATMYHKVYTDYRSRLAGLYARMYEGRCHGKLDKHDEALNCFDDLLDQPDEPDAFRDLKRRTLGIAVSSWIDDDRTAHEELIQRVGKYVDQAKADQKELPEYLFLQLSLARAYKMRAAALKRSAGDVADVKAALDKARELAEFVAMRESQHQDDARKLLASLNEDK